MLRIAGRRHAFASVMNIRMAKVVRQGQAGRPAGVGPLTRHAALHTAAKRRGHVRVPLLEGPPGAPISRAATSQAVGATRRARRATTPQGGDARVDRRVAAEGLPIAGALQLLPVGEAAIGVQQAVPSKVVQGTEGVPNTPLLTRKAAVLSPPVATQSGGPRVPPRLPSAAPTVGAPREVLGRPGDVAP